MSCVSIVEILNIYHVLSYAHSLSRKYVKFENFNGRIYCFYFLLFMALYLVPEWTCECVWLYNLHYFLISSSLSHLVLHRVSWQHDTLFCSARQLWPLSFPLCIKVLPLRDSWESLGLQGGQASPSSRKLTLNIHWKDWCWRWTSNNLATQCEEPTHWQISWSWERLKAKGEGDSRGWDD